MGFGSTAKKLQKVADMAEDVYAKLTALREEVEETRETVEETAERTERLESEVAEQRAVMDRLLEANGLDPEAARGSLGDPDGGVDVDRSAQSDDQSTATE